MTSVKGAVRAAKAAEKKLITDRVTKISTGSSLDGTQDSFANLFAKLGIGTDNISSGATYGFNPVSRNRVLLEWMHRGSWLAGVAIDLVANDMTRAGVTIRGELKPEKIEEIEEYATQMGVWNSINETIKWSRLYGGCIAVLLIDGQDVSKKLRLETVGRDQFKGLLPIDRWSLQPVLNNLVEQFGPHLGMPQWYDIMPGTRALAGKRVHYSRIIRLGGIQLPYWQSLTENLWGESELERLYDRMVAFDSATQGAAQLVYKAYIRTYKVKGLREIIATGGPGMDGLTKYVDMMRRFQSIEGITLMDGEDEFEGESHTAFTGLSDALMQFGQQLAGALQIPLVRLFGQSPAGLNSSGESDLKTYYDGINQRQVATLKVPLTDVYRAIAQSLGIKVPDGFSIKFNPLWQLNETEKADVASKTTETVTKALEAGTVSQKIAMQELKQSSEITGVWTNITDKDINTAEEDLPPGPAEAAEQAQELAEQSAAEGGDDDKDEPAVPAAKAKKKTPDSMESDIVYFATRWLNEHQGASTEDLGKAIAAKFHLTEAAGLKWAKKA